MSNESISRSKEDLIRDLINDKVITDEYSDKEKVWLVAHKLAYSKEFPLLDCNIYPLQFLKDVRTELLSIYTQLGQEALHDSYFDASRLDLAENYLDHFNEWVSFLRKHNSEFNQYLCEFEID